MNIKQAKEQIKNAITAYFTKDKFGNYIIPLERQRPIFLMGPPGVGKTAIMEQISEELGVGLISYSMTHHTRQSALGLPFIEKETFNGVEYNISEYTMSEIIASTYKMMEQTGLKEGILFLDEINCVSETLAPAMLQFLQYKIFGCHRIPEGWIVVTAGNPPEYNNSVREFDIATWDRLKRIDVEPDFHAWKEFAYKKGVHASIITYLDIRKKDFYKVESTIDGKNFVTARGWSDLSDMIKLYELHNIPVDKMLVRQYIQDKKIAMDFATYYDLFKKYQSDYQVDHILEGNESPEILKRANKAKFDERLSLLGLIIDKLTIQLKEEYLTENTVRKLMAELKEVKVKLSAKSPDAEGILEAHKLKAMKELKKGKIAGTLSDDEKYILQDLHLILSEIQKQIKQEEPKTGAEAFAIVKAAFDKKVAGMKQQIATTGKSLSNAFNFCDKAFGEGQEILILVTELTMGYYGPYYINHYGCKEYFAHNKQLMFHERQMDIIKEIDMLEDKNI